MHIPIRSATVQPHNGRPTLTVNGEPTSALVYMTYAPKAENFAAFDRRGVRIMSFTATCDSHLWPWAAKPVCLGPDEYDYSDFDARVRAVAEAAPHSWLLPRVYVLPPLWWCRQHPEDLVQFGEPRALPRPLADVEDGRPLPSFASQAWREFGAETLARLVRHVQEGPWADRVLGYHIATGHTEEWIWWGAPEGRFADYSPAMQAGFRGFLAQRYSTDAALQAAWRRDDVKIATAEVPPLARRVHEGYNQIRKPETEQDVADYILCHSDMVAQTLCRFARAVKAALTSPRLVVAFYGYMANFGHHAFLAHNAGHLAVERVLECPDVDGLTSPSIYVHRGIDNGYSGFMGPTESVALHGKLWFDENDHRTHLPRYRPYNGATRSERDTLCLQRRQFAAVIQHAAGMWWFDMSGNWYDAAMHQEVQWSAEVDRRALQTDRSSAAEIALVWDPKSLAYTTGQAAVVYALLNAPLASFGRCGAPFDVLLLSDLPKARDYHLYVFLNAWHLSAEERRMIERVVRRDGKTALWIYAAGYVGKDSDHLLAQSETTGIRTAIYSGHVPPTTVVPDGPHPIVAGLGESLTYGRDAWMMSPLLIADDPDAASLGFWESDEELPLLAARDFGSWRSVWSCAPNPPASLIRRIARWAGVHIYSETDDPFYANRSFAALSAGSAGPRTIRLPRRGSVYELSAPNREWTDVEEISLDMPKHHTSLFFLGSKKAWEQLG